MQGTHNSVNGQEKYSQGVCCDQKTTLKITFCHILTIKIFWWKVKRMHTTLYKNGAQKTCYLPNYILFQILMLIKTNN